MPASPGFPTTMAGISSTTFGDGSLRVMNTSIGDVLIDGSPVSPGEAAISVFDIGFQRGYGCFEAMRAYDGRIFRIDGHLDRLAVSAAKLHLPLPAGPDLAAWCRFHRNFRAFSTLLSV